MVDFSKKELLYQGAEAKIYSSYFHGRSCVIKERFSKKYRHHVLDATLTTQRTKSEIRSMVRCRMNGIKTPAIYFIDLENHLIIMEYLHSSVSVRDYIRNLQDHGDSDKEVKLRTLGVKIGTTIAKMHKNNIIHGDLTSSNMLLNGPPENSELYMIDFGLAHKESVAEDKGVDLYVLERALISTHPNSQKLFLTIVESYKNTYGQGCEEIISKFEEVQQRGRKRAMVG